MSSKIRLPQGVADRPPARARALHEHASAIARVFELSGYDPVDTPPFELLDVLERGLGEGAKKTLFRMVDPASGEIVVLRPDFTAQVARLVTLRMAERPRPLRLRYQGRVLRAADPLGRGLRSRELFQAGAELIGATEAWADVEALTLGARALEHVGRPLTIDLGHAGVIPALGAPASDADAVHAALRAKNAADLRAVAPALAPLVDLFGGFEVLDRARRALPALPAVTA
ncbi:ATP phosphoribosyltransferase regulatory subunit, partial [Myxococcota bacterium]|nr:ATP phosphoribosyltransferase regulatory subunit [Myxococcota bacterium]